MSFLSVNFFAVDFYSVPFVAEFAELLTTALIHFVWQGLLLPLLLIITVKALNIRTVRLRYLLSVGTLLAMGLAPLLTIAWHQQLKVTQSVEVSGNATPADGAASTDDAGINTEVQRVFATLRSPGIAVAVLIAWLAGVLILSTRLAIGFRTTLWIRAGREPLSEPFSQRIQILGTRLKVDTRNRVFASVRVAQAVAVGIIRPVVLIPAAWLTQFTPEVLEAVVAHELAHIRRWDLWINLVQRVIETLLFYHPAVWWLSRRIRFEREICCDEMAASCLDRAAYARSLESVARIAHGNLLMATSIQGGTRMNLLNRIKHLLGTAPTDTAGNWWAAGFVALALPVVAAVAFSVVASSAPSVATAEDGKEGVTEITGGVEVVLQDDLDSELKVIGAGSVEVRDDLEPNGYKITADNVVAYMRNPGDVVVIKMTGELAKKYGRFHGITICDGGAAEIETSGYVEQILKDGRCRIEHSTRIRSDKKSPRLVTVTAIVDPKKLQTRTIPKDIEVFSSPGDANPALTKSDQTCQFVELSDLKGIKIQTWELKEEIGE